MYEPPDPVLTATEHPPPPEALERSIEPVPDEAGAATPTGFTGTLPSAALVFVTVIVTVSPAMTAPATSWKPPASTWYTLLPAAMPLGKVTLNVAEVPCATPSALERDQAIREFNPFRLAGLVQPRTGIRDRHGSAEWWAGRGRLDP